MNIKDLAKLQITIGKGQASFPMERGSFRYIDKLEWKKPLHVTALYHGSSEECEMVELLLDDEEGRPVGSVEITEENGLWKLHPDITAPEVNRFWLSLPLPKETHVYGGGETFAAFDLRGQLCRVWTAEHQNAERIGKKLAAEKIRGKRPDKVNPLSEYESYYVQPTFITSDKWFWHADSKGYAEIDLRQEGKLIFHVREQADIYVGAAETFPELSGKLTKLLGRPFPMPEWAFDGMIMGIQRGADEVDYRIEQANEHGVKLTGVWCQDWCGCRKTGFGYQVMWNWQADEDLYPNLKEKIAKWNEEGVHFLAYLNPFMAIEKNLYEYASAHGYCVKAPDGSDYLVTITTFPAAMIDLTNPEAREWFKGVIKRNLLDLGISGWMADFGEYLPVDAVLYSGEDAHMLHNSWPAMWAKLNREAICEYMEENGGDPNEILIFTRAGYTGTVGVGNMMWNGDQHVDWSKDDGLPSVIPASLSLAASGSLLVHSDVGGYTTMMHMTREKELLQRWEEMNAFSVLMRSHEGNQPSRNVQTYTDDELWASLKAAVDQHLKLKPYLKQCVKEAVEEGLPVMRPLFYYYDEAPAYTEKFEYLLGRDILVCPVLEKGAKKRTVYLPSDGWIELATGLYFEGGTVTVAAPLGTIPVFVRKESGLYNQIK